jgi:hypothetical protein
MTGLITGWAKVTVNVPRPLHVPVTAQVSTVVMTVSVGVELVRLGEYKVALYPLEPAVVAPPVRDVAPEAVQVWESPDPVIVLTPPENTAAGAS